MDQVAREKFYSERIYKPWNGETPVFLAFTDIFFTDVEKFLEYCDENSLNPEEQKLFHAEPVFFHEVDEDYWEDCFTDENYEDGLPKPIKEALDNLNKVIREYKKPALWEESNTRTHYIKNDK